LLLYGQGANGKSVLADIVFALLGHENVSSYSLQNLTAHAKSERAELQNKLLNYATEINGRMEVDIFKQLVSGEPVEARRLFHDPFIMTRYAKLMFNCNVLPTDVEQTNAFFRRFLIVGFNTTIPEEKQDKELAQRIIRNELSGIFNWVLEGLSRLLVQKQFTSSEAVRKQMEEYQLQSDSVKMFLLEEGYTTSIGNEIALQHFFELYQIYCKETGCHPVGRKRFVERLKNCDYYIVRKAQCNFVYAEKTL
jgi:putative DNA primase/helicase